MNLQGNLSIGALSVPRILIVVAAVWAAGCLTGLLSLNRSPALRRRFVDLLLSPLLPFLLTWKLSLFVTDLSDVLRSPLMILYSAGGAANIAAGFVAAAAAVVLNWRRVRTETGLTRAAVRSAVVMGTAVLFVAAVAFLTADRTDTRESIPRTVVIGDDGEPVMIGDRTGTPVVVNFWASWCPPCRAEMPMLIGLAEDTRFTDVSFRLINAAATEKNPDETRSWIESQGYRFKGLYDPDGRAMKAFGVDGLPTTLVISADGRVVARRTGAVSRSWIVSNIRKARRNG